MPTIGDSIEAALAAYQYQPPPQETHHEKIVSSPNKTSPTKVKAGDSGITLISYGRFHGLENEDVDMEAVPAETTSAPKPKKNKRRITHPQIAAHDTTEPMKRKKKRTPWKITPIVTTEQIEENETIVTTESIVEADKIFGGGSWGWVGTNLPPPGP